MPIAVYNGEKIQIPFDPEYIAGLIYRGIEVYPDKETDEKQAEIEKTLVQAKLKKLWGNQNVRTKNDRDVLKQLPAMREDARFSGRILPHGDQGADFLNVVPNPNTKMKINQVDPGKLPTYQERVRTAPRTTWNMTGEQNEIPTFSYGLRQA